MRKGKSLFEKKKIKKKKNKKQKKTVTSLSLLTIFPQTLHPRCLDGFKYTPETAVKEYDVT